MLLLLSRFTSYFLFISLKEPRLPRTARRRHRNGEQLHQHKAQPIISCSDLDTHKEPSCGEECNVAKDSYSLVIAVNRDGCIGASDGSCLAMFHQAAPWGVGTNIFATNQGQEMLPDGSCAVDVESQELEGGLGCVRRG